jgi:hypothetical protein
MVMKKNRKVRNPAYYLIITLSLLTGKWSAAIGQEVNFSFETGPGQYAMNDLKDFNNIQKRGIPFDSKIVANFPLYYYYYPSIKFSFRRILAFGASYIYQSTGSRISHVDYSGIYNYDTEVDARGYGGTIEFFYRKNKFRIALRNNFGEEKTELLINEESRVMNGLPVRIGTNYDSRKSYYYFPALEFSYSLWLFRIGLSAGYYFDLDRNEFKPHAYTVWAPDYLSISNNKHAKPDWSGFRIGASVSFDLMQFFIHREDKPAESK